MQDSASKKLDYYFLKSKKICPRCRKNTVNKKVHCISCREKMCANSKKWYERKKNGVLAGG